MSEIIVLQYPEDDAEIEPHPNTAPPVVPDEYGGVSGGEENDQEEDAGEAA